MKAESRHALPRLEDLLAEVDAATDMADLGQRTLAAIRPFGLQAAASGIIAGSKAASAERFHFALWPPAFLERYLAEEMQAIDPVPRWARGTGSPARYSTILAHLSAKDPGRRVIQAAAEFDLRTGICVPQRAADGAIGLISVVGDRPDFAPAEFRSLVALCNAIFRSAEHIDRSSERATAAPVLTLREIELLGFLVHGHSDREIAQLNAISESTVRFHLHNARQKVGAVSRTHLAAKVVALGFVTL
jgi:DNA-binding CsgD family transcriptional regulator